MEQDDEQQRQQADGGEEERDGDGLVIAPVEVMRGGVQAGERQPEHEQRPATPSTASYHRWAAK